MEVEMLLTWGQSVKQLPQLNSFLAYRDILMVEGHGSCLRQYLAGGCVFSGTEFGIECDSRNAGAGR